MKHLNEKHTWFNLDKNEECVLRYTTTDEQILPPYIVRRLGEVVFNKYGYAGYKKSINMPDEIFSNCKNLKSIKIPEGTTYIGSHAFYGCENLKSISIPDTVIAIGQFAFTNCLSLPVVDGIQYADNCVVKAENIDKEKYKFKKGIKFIGDMAFMISKIKSITIPNTVLSIGAMAFYGCEELKTITIESTNIETIDTETFANCTSLEEFIIPNSVKYIYNAAFKNCTNLKRIYIPKSVKRISDGVFSNCPSLLIEYEGTKEDFEKIREKFFAVQPIVNIKYNQKF